MTTTTTDRLGTANAALALFTRGISLYRDRGRVGVEFPNHGKDRDKNPVHRKIWTAQNGSTFYPKWYRHFCHGGTVTTALATLVRWVRLQPVYPIGAWRYWVSETVGMGRCGGNDADRGPEIISTLLAGGYPEVAECVLCEAKIARYDWWSLDGVSGPCCHWNVEGGCRQTGVKA